MLLYPLPLSALGCSIFKPPLGIRFQRQILSMEKHQEMQNCKKCLMCCFIPILSLHLASYGCLGHVAVHSKTRTRRSTTCCPVPNALTSPPDLSSSRVFSASASPCPSPLPCNRDDTLLKILEGIFKTPLLVVMNRKVERLREEAWRVYCLYDYAITCIRGLR